MHRFTLFFYAQMIALLLSGCTHQPIVSTQVASVLDDYRHPQGLSDQELIDQDREFALKHPGVHVSPLAWPDFNASDRIQKLVDQYGQKAVAESLIHEIKNNGVPRANRALTLLSEIDDTDEWMDVWP